MTVPSARLALALCSHPRPGSHGLGLSPRARVLSASQSSPSAVCLLISGSYCQRICPGRPPRSPLRAPADCGRMLPQALPPASPSSGRWWAPRGPPCLGSALQSCASSHPQEASCNWPVQPGLLQSRSQSACSPPGRAQGGASASEPMSPPPPTASRQREDTRTPLQLCPCQRTGRAPSVQSRASAWPGAPLGPPRSVPWDQRVAGAPSVASSTLASDSPGVRS